MITRRNWIKAVAALVPGLPLLAKSKPEPKAKPEPASSCCCGPCSCCPPGSYVLTLTDGARDVAFGETEGPFLEPGDLVAYNPATGKFRKATRQSRFTGVVLQVTVEL